MKAGVAQTAGVKGLAKIASEHHYNGNPSSVADLMRKSSVAGQIGQFKPEVAAAQAAGLEYEFGETGSIGGHGAAGVSNVAGAAIWAVDYVFQALSIGAKRIYFHNGVCYRYNMFQPISNCNDGSPFTEPHIMPMYHVLLILAEAVSFSGAVKVAELDTGSADVSAYGVWAANNSTLLRVVIVNSAAWYSTSSAPRSTYKYALENFPAIHASANGTKPWVRRLSIPGVEHSSGINWAGQSFETPSGAPNGSRVDEPFSGSSIAGWQSEVVVVYFSED